MPIFNELEPREVGFYTKIPFVDPNIDPVKLALALYDRGAQFPLLLTVSPNQVVPLYTWISSPSKHPNLTPEQNTPIDQRQILIPANTELSYKVTGADYHPEAREDKHATELPKIDPNTTPEVRHELAIVSYANHGLERSFAERMRAVLSMPMTPNNLMGSFEAGIKAADLERQRIKFSEFYPADGPALARYSDVAYHPGNMNGLWPFVPSTYDYLQQVWVEFYLAD